MERFKIYLLDNQSNRIRVYLNNEAIQVFKTPAGCTDISVQDDTILAHDGHRVWLIHEDQIDPVFTNTSATSIKSMRVDNKNILLELSNGNIAHIGPQQKKPTLYLKSTFFSPSRRNWIKAGLASVIPDQRK